jgi:hypothetical protein
MVNGISFQKKTAAGIPASIETHMKKIVYNIQHPAQPNRFNATMNRAMAPRVTMKSPTKLVRPAQANVIQGGKYYRLPK